MNDRGVPDLQQLMNQKTGAQVAALARELNPDGTLHGVATDRGRYLDATQLLYEIRQIVKEEVRSLRNEMREEQKD